MMQQPPLGAGTAPPLGAPGATRRRPLRVMAMVSATGRNLVTLLRLGEARPDLVEVVLVASDRPASGALTVARSAGVPAWPGSFADECGSWRACRTDAERAAYAERARAFHDRLCRRIDRFEAAHGAIDLVVLAYHRWVHGELLEKFTGRILNQHPGDLADLDGAGRRRLVGLDPVGVALRLGRARTRTSTFLVDDSHDGGAIVARGPWVPYLGPNPVTDDAVVAHELRQKELSDAPALTWAVTAFAEGRVSVHPRRRHRDGSAVVLVDGVETPLGGHEVPAPGAASPVPTPEAAPAPQVPAVERPLPAVERPVPAAPAAVAAQAPGPQERVR